jgi:hypothetical protein
MFLPMKLLSTRSVFRTVAMRVVLFSLALMGSGFSARAEESVARLWNEALLYSIRNDLARPTVHARNLFHISAAMYDAWAVYDEEARPFFLGRTVGNYTFPFDGIAMPENKKQAQEIAISYAAYRLIAHRFQLSSQVINIYANINGLMAQLGLNPSVTSINYSDGDPRKLGNYIAFHIIQFGLQDGSNEQEVYANQYYEPVNPDLDIYNSSTIGTIDPNRWQRLAIVGFMDQAGNVFNDTPPFLSAEWGNVVPFSLREDQVTVHERNGDVYRVFLDMGDPPYLDLENPTDWESIYKWGFQLVSIWQSHLAPEDETMWDISPGAMGNTSWLPEPQAYEDYPLYYRTFEGGTHFAEGHPVNPATGMPYEPNLVKRGDYSRILAEFWADGPDSETPPGHWFTIMNYVTDHPMFEKKWGGEGEVLSDLDWDVRLYFALGGAMHDAAVTCWSHKGWYDYARPITAIRYMAEKGQSSDSNLPSYHPQGMVLIPDHVELVMPGDPLAGDNDEHLYKIKLNTWKGAHDSLLVPDPELDHAGVGWILAENWFPYQRPSFVTPPFAGYMSGHSTYSRTAAELVTLMTGTQYFPGGMGEFVAHQDEFLEFENGPSETVVLQFATYQDASDQCSLSRIWGGIHPPADDIPGRYLGMELGPQAWEYANDFMVNGAPKVTDVGFGSSILNDDVAVSGFSIQLTYSKEMNGNAPVISFPNSNVLSSGTLTSAGGEWINDHTYIANFTLADNNTEMLVPTIQVKDAIGANEVAQQPYIGLGFYIDTKNPTVTDATISGNMITDAQVGTGGFSVTLVFDEEMDSSVFPTIFYPGANGAGTLQFNPAMSSWEGNVCVKYFNVIDQNIEVGEIFIGFEIAKDGSSNVQVPYTHYEAIAIDTKNPIVNSLTANDYLVTNSNVGGGGFVLIAIFNEAMNTTTAPSFSFPDADVSSVLTLNTMDSEWLNPFTFVASFDVAAGGVIIQDIDIQVAGASDIPGNPTVVAVYEDFFSIDQVSSVAELETSGTLAVFPNPVRVGQNLNVTWPANLGAHTVFVANGLGQLVFSRSLADVSGHRFEIPTGKFESGTYFVGVVTATGHLTTRAIVKK